MTRPDPSDGPRAEAPIRIAYFSGMTMGGAERQMLELAKGLPRDRFAVEFVVFGRQGATAAEAAALGFPVRVLGAARPPDSARILAPLRGALIVWRFIRLSRRRRYDIVDGWLFYGYAMAALSRPLSRLPVVVAGRRSMNAFKRRHGPIAGLADAIARRWSDAIVANSDAVAADVAATERLPRDRITVIRNGVAPGIAGSSLDRERWRAMWGADDPATVVIACVAAFRPVKGHELLLRAMALARGRSMVRVRLVLIGDGPLRGVLERQVVDLGLTDVVVFHGEVADARPLYDAAEIVVQASSEEGLPNSLLEGAAAGRALVATAAGGTSEIVVDGVTGWLVPVGDAEALADAIAEAIVDPVRRARQAAAAREHVLTTFAMDRMIGEFDTLYTTLVSRARHRRGRFDPRHPRQRE